MSVLGFLHGVLTFQTVSSHLVSPFLSLAGLPDLPVRTQSHALLGLHGIQISDTLGKRLTMSITHPQPPIPPPFDIHSLFQKII